MADNEINYDDLNDDEFLAALEEAGIDQSEEIENTEEENIEDTNQEEDSDENELDETDTNEQDDEIVQETEEFDENEEEEELEGNTQIETNSETEDEDEKSIEAGSEESDTNETPDEDNDETEEVNYEEQYKALLDDNTKLKGFESFYNEVTSEFVANGKKVKGFTDPKKIIESQQMAAGFSDKMAGFSKYKPFMNAIKDHGFLDNPEKFNLAMNLFEGDQEALKKHIKDLEIDPFEMDMENINYKNKNQVSSNLEIAYDDVLSNANRHDVRKEVEEVISKTWDDKSVVSLLEDPQSSADLVNHISTGVYDTVQERIAEKKRTDIHNVYSSKPSIDQYREAAKEIETEYINYVNVQNQQEVDSMNQEISEQAIQDEIVKIEQERKDEEYRSKVEKENSKANEARKKATSVSKKKPRTNTKKKVFDPTNANDEEFTKYMDSIIYS